jgi:sporadic carbohydrate cluster 2OG-Fe(II) oxygenase
MEFLSNSEKKIANSFKKKGFIVSKAENRRSLTYIKNKIISIIQKKLKTKTKINLNKFHEYIDIDSLNEFRVHIINQLNMDQKIRLHYFNLGKRNLYDLVGNELMMQKNLNLSIQCPNDSSSLLPIHSDVWSGDSAYEINLWLPLVNCYKTKSMYILNPRNYESFLDKGLFKKTKNTDELYKKVKKKVNFLKVNYGEYVIFNQNLPHGNIVNKEKTTRWSLNCRFKSLFSPYNDKRIGEFFLPITTKVMTELGLNYKSPF